MVIFCGDFCINMLNGNTNFISSRLTPSLNRLKGHPWRNAPDVKVSFVVAGAGGEAINGRYVLVDTQNGRPRYKLEHGQAAT